jgi:hypothetical protein
MKTKKTMYVPLLLAVIIFISIVFYHWGEIWIPSLVHRYISLPSDISYKMALFFESDLLYYSYSFLSLFFKYHGNDVPSKIIGDIYYSVGDNATASFLVDSYINIGYLGLFLLCGAIISLRLLVIRNPRSILILPFIFQLIDTPMPTAFLTGGGFLALLIICGNFKMISNFLRRPVYNKN